MKKPRDNFMPIETYEETVSTLDKLRFKDRFQEFFWSLKYHVEYGPRKHLHLDFYSFKDASVKFRDNSGYDINTSIQRWTTDLKDLKRDKRESIILDIIEIFDWGGVTKNNIQQALILHRDDKLIGGLECARKYFSGNSLSAVPTKEAVPFSSGWTKVYSFLCPCTVIYDSRCSAFLNYALLMGLDRNNQTTLTTLRPLAETLLNFEGVPTRTRMIDRKKATELGLQNLAPSDDQEKGLKANLMASWIVKYLAERLPNQHELNQAEYRDFDKAFYMLGFDLVQLPSLNWMKLQDLYPENEDQEQ